MLLLVNCHCSFYSAIRFGFGLVRPISDATFTTSRRLSNRFSSPNLTIKLRTTIRLFSVGCLGWSKESIFRPTFFWKDLLFGIFGPLPSFSSMNNEVIMKIKKLLHIRVIHLDNIPGQFEFFFSRSSPDGNFVNRVVSLCVQLQGDSSATRRVHKAHFYRSLRKAVNRTHSWLTQLSQ